MTFKKLCSIAAMFVTILPVVAAQKTAAAAVTADDAWSQAEQTGDTNYIDSLLLPDYRSVGADGSVHDKAAIIEGARKHAGSQSYAQKVAQWRAAHPMATKVVIAGDTVILTFYLTSLGPEKGVMSSDIFIFQHQRWRALYSQHTDAGR